MFGSGRDSPQMSGSGQESLSDVQGPSWMSWSGWEALPNVQKLSGGTPGCPGVVLRPSSMSGYGREALPDVRETRP